MTNTILRLFRTNLAFQVILAFICFTVVMGLILARLIYLHGLTASFSGTKPHLSITLTEGATTDLSRIQQLTDHLERSPAVAAVSPFIKSSRFLHIKSLDDNIFDEPEASQVVEIVAIDLDRFPFAIPLEETRSYQRSGYHNPYTYKELAYALNRAPNAVVINQALSALFSSSLEFTGAYAVSGGKTSGYLGEISILSVMKDLEDTPRLFTSLKTAEMLLGALEYSGVLVRLEHPENLERVQLELIESLSLEWDLTTLTIKNWKEEENKQKKIFDVFNALFWPVIGVILLMSLFGCILGVYRTFIVKRRSLQIMLNLGMSRHQLFGILAGISMVALSLGLAFSLGLLWLIKDPFVAAFLEQLKQIVKVEQVHVPWVTLCQWGLGLFMIYLILFLLFLGLMVSEKKAIGWAQRIDSLNQIALRWRRLKNIFSFGAVETSTVFGRPGIISRVLFRNVELLVRFGLAIGVVFGLGIAVGGNLFIHHTMSSYQQFLQRSLIGLRGSLILTSSPRMMEAFLRQEGDRIDIPKSAVWSSPEPIRIELKQGPSELRIQARVILLEKQYLIDKLESQAICLVTSHIDTIAFGNHLLIRALSGMNVDQPFSFHVKNWGEARYTVRFSGQTACSIDTGMMADYPVLFLTWESLGLDPFSFSQKASLEFYTLDRAETGHWQKKLKTIMDRISINLSHRPDIRPIELDVEPPENLFDSVEMKLADSIAKQAGYFSVLIVAVTGFFAIVILIYGFSLLLELKRKNLQTIQELGMENRDVAAGFLIRGLRIGLASAATGIITALGTRFLVETGQWIPYQQFFSDWNPYHFAMVALVIPVSIGLFSGGIVYLFLANPVKLLRRQRQKWTR